MIYFLLNKTKNVEVSDTTGDAICTTVRFIIIF